MQSQFFFLWKTTVDICHWFEEYISKTQSCIILKIKPRIVFCSFRLGGTSRTAQPLVANDIKQSIRDSVD